MEHQRWTRCLPYAKTFGSMAEWGTVRTKDPAQLKVMDSLLLNLKEFNSTGIAPLPLICD